jgi:pyrophosphatase PpaX
MTKMTTTPDPNPRPPTPIEAVLFDLDGTLVDSLDLIVTCWQHTTEQHLGYRIAREWVLPTIGRPLIECLDELAPGRGEALLATYRAYNLEHHDRLIRLPDGTHAMLHALRVRGLRTALVTAKGREIAGLALARFDLGPLLDVLVTHESTPHHKPHPAPVLFACDALGLPPAAACYVGDSVFDMQAGRAAGARAVGVAWGADTPANLIAAGAQHIIHTWTDLLAWIARSTLQ